MNTQAQKFFSNGIAIVKISDWLNWASGKFDTANSYPILLPMIQRGSVWKPHQVMDLWDTLLRGMPLGSMMANRVKSESRYFTPIKRELQALPCGRGLSLIDGQQRTLSMLLAWPNVGNEMRKRIWVDLGCDDKNDHLFRFHFTTEHHPFGFQLAGQSGSSVQKLPLSDRRLALLSYGDLLKGIEEKPINEHMKARTEKLWFDKAVLPWHGVLPVNLQSILKLLYEVKHEREGFQIEMQNLRAEREKTINDRIAAIQSQQYNEEKCHKLIAHFEKQLQQLTKNAEIETRINRLYDALKRFTEQHMPIIEVQDHVFSSDSETEGQDPALAVLFHRIGTGGTALSNADYVFSVIKHRCPECHELVESLLENPRIAALFTPVTLVNTAVRLTAAKLGMDDYAKIDKTQFARLLKGKDEKDKSGNFLTTYTTMIGESGYFSRTLNVLLNVIAYRPDQNDVGLPKHALCILEMPVIEVMLCWLQNQDPMTYDAAVNTNRLRLIRFALYCALAVKDQSKASALLFKKLKDNPCGNEFPDKLLIDELVKEKMAYLMRSPADYKNSKFLQKMVSSPDDSDNNNVLRGWPRFAMLDRTQDEQDAIQLYLRFWRRNGSYSHTLLLWLQRDYVYANFEGVPALPGTEDETPYDYDHIFAQNDWAGWQGDRGENRILDFVSKDGNNDKAETLLGNSIGNVRVWSSSDNRSDGDISVPQKLKLNDNGSTDTKRLCLDSLITGTETQAWIDGSAAEADNHRHWNKHRALAFQRAIEYRTFNLYEKFYNDLGLGHIA